MFQIFIHCLFLILHTDFENLLYFFNEFMYKHIYIKCYVPFWILIICLIGYKALAHFCVIFLNKLKKSVVKAVKTQICMNLFYSIW